MDTVRSTANAAKIKTAGRGVGINEGEWTCKVGIRTRKKLLVVGEACMAIF